MNLIRQLNPMQGYATINIQIASIVIKSCWSQLFGVVYVNLIRRLNSMQGYDY